jgi:hypothetical protein
MIRTAVTAALMLVMIAALQSGCGIIGPTCSGQTGSVFSISGELAAGAMVVHEVPYGTEGSQNDGQFTWVGAAPDDPKPELFFTRTECNEFDHHNPEEDGPCAVLARAGWDEGRRHMSYILTHGQGNPLTLGPSDHYKLWIVGDSAQTVFYTLSARWNRPVDC